MGNSITPTYRVEFTGVVAFDGKTTPRRIRLTNAGWRVQSRHHVTGSGKPTGENLRTYVMEYETVEPDGSFIRIGSARIVHQATGEVVATYEPAAFEVA